MELKHVVYVTVDLQGALLCFLAAGCILASRRWEERLLVCLAGIEFLDALSAVGDAVAWGFRGKSESLVRLKGVRFDRINSSRKNTKDIFELKGDELQSTLGNFNNNKEEQVSEKFEGSGDTDFSLDSLLGSKGRSLGIFRLTAYDACIICCGKTDGITATGTKAEVGRTIAVDSNVIPFGTRVMIDGHIYMRLLEVQRSLLP